MATFYTHHDMERGEFQDMVEEYPELVLIVGRVGVTYGIHSLASVIDEYKQIFITNSGNGWSVLVVREGRAISVRGTARRKKRRARRS